MKKIAITLPEAQAKAVEDIRRKRRIPRSRVIQQAVALFLEEEGRLQAVRSYELGYRRKPERQSDATAFARAAAAAMQAEDWS